MLNQYYEERCGMGRSASEIQDFLGELWTFGFDRLPEDLVRPYRCKTMT